MITANVFAKKNILPTLFSTYFGSWRTYTNQYIANEISTLTKYYSQLIQLCPRPNDQLILYNSIQSSNKKIIAHPEDLPNLSLCHQIPDTVILLNGIFNHSLDIADLLKKIHQQCDRTTRIFSVIYNPYLSFLYKLANVFGIRQGETPHTFITKRDLNNLALLSGFQVVRTQNAVYFPWRLFGIGQARTPA